MEQRVKHPCVIVMNMDNFYFGHDFFIIEAILMKLHTP